MYCHCHQKDHHPPQTETQVKWRDAESPKGCVLQVRKHTGTKEEGEMWRLLLKEQRQNIHLKYSHLLLVTQVLTM